MESEEAVIRLTPDITALNTVDARGIIVTAPGTETDFVSRFFAPRVGVPEDPVTGSAHCALAPYWSARFGRPSLVGAQLSARGGLVHVTHAGDRVHLAGRAVTVLSGTLHV
uniref:Phenazine biosynthesis protein PhzF like n=1 Tax=Nonomuraea gerenzanensis TaxID=93944 RepID=A0A1M4ERE3_9ACTN|nr:PhzF family phenazine biosynthesis protein [Nonomuraea gerenzanensis]SBP01398.1 Phenazine biosynthesis protein PhzF like [Nonomuraea gerenzanensis]